MTELRRIIEQFPGLVTDEEVNGGDLVEFISEMAQGFTRPDSDGGKTTCQNCGGDKIQVNLFGWFLCNEGLMLADIDGETDPRCWGGFYCENCGDTTDVDLPHGMRY